MRKTANAEISFKQVELETNINGVEYLIYTPHGKVFGYLSDTRDDFEVIEIETSTIYYMVEDVENDGWKDCEETNELYQTFITYIEKLYSDPKQAEAVA